MYLERKILNVKLKKSKIHYLPNVVYSQVPTFEKFLHALQMDILLPQKLNRCPQSIRDGRRFYFFQSRTLSATSDAFCGGGIFCCKQFFAGEYAKI